MPIPDVTGFLLEEAENVLKLAGVTKVVYLQTSAPRNKSNEITSNMRVVKQITLADGETEELTVSNCGNVKKAPLE